MKSLRHLLLSVCLLAGASPLFAVAKPFQQEKVYLHFDNTAYFLGETIWFKAYVVQAGRNGLSPLSKTLYVELVSPDETIVETKKFKLEDGKADGYFTLSSTLAGYYQIRAYTRFILNQGDDAVFSRAFACYDNPKPTGNFRDRTWMKSPVYQEPLDWRTMYTEKRELNLGFFPEGGHLVEGLASTIAFKATKKDGKQANISGVVISEEGDTIAAFGTSHQGMGSFLLTPPFSTVDANNEKLTALVVCDNKQNKLYKFALPKALPSGYVLSVDNSDQNQVNIMVQCSAGLPNEPLGIDISCRGIIYGEDTLAFSRGNVLSLSFPTRLLPSGVTQITLHSIDGRPLAERLIFVNHHSEMHIEATPDKSSYRPYEPININFDLKDNKGNPIETDFSLSVKDAVTSPYDAYADNILTDLLLSSELRGNIETPGYYFMDESPERRNNLDILMLTQGWTRYDWKRVAGIDTTQYHHPYEESLLIEGNVSTWFKDKKKEGVEVNMILYGDSTSQRGTCKSDSTGRFNMKLEDFYGTSDLVVETKNKEKRKDHIIRIDQVFSPQIKTLKASEKKEPIWADIQLTDDATEVDSSQQEPIWTDSIWVTMGKRRDRNSTALPEVQVNAKRQEGRQQWISKVKEDATLVIDAQRTIDNIVDTSDWYPSTIPELLLKKLPYYEYNGVSFYKGKPAIVILYNQRGLPLSTEIQIPITMRDIQYITVKEGFGIEPRHPDFEKFIYIYAELDNRPPVGIRQTKFEGYSFTKTFYSPPYDKLVIPDPDDVRRTLYWNPSVKTDSNGKASVSFYNNRSAKTINISAETVTEKGVIGVLK